MLVPCSLGWKVGEEELTWLGVQEFSLELLYLRVCGTPRWS